MSEWISVKESLPTVRARLVVTNKLTGALHLARYATTGGSHNPHEIFENFKGEQLFDVTHWLKIPEVKND